MKINSIKNNVNFSKAIEVQIDSLPYFFNYEYKNLKPKMQSPAHDVVEILKNKPTKYDSETSSKIASFLKRYITDISPKQGGILSRIVNGDFYIFSGKEAIKAREIIEDAIIEKQRLEDKYILNGYKDEVERIKFESPKIRKILKQNVTLERDKKLKELAQDQYGTNSPAFIDIKTQDGRIKKIEYADEGKYDKTTRNSLCL